jgi:hypothetical protein
LDLFGLNLNYTLGFYPGNFISGQFFFEKHIEKLYLFAIQKLELERAEINK